MSDGTTSATMSPQEQALTSPALRGRRKAYYPEAWADRVPLKVRMTRTVQPDPLLTLVNPGIRDMLALGGDQYYAWVNSLGAVAAILDDGRRLGWHDWVPVPDAMG